MGEQQPGRKRARTGSVRLAVPHHCSQPPFPSPSDALGCEVGPQPQKRSRYSGYLEAACGHVSWPPAMASHAKGSCRTSHPCGR